MVLAMDNMVMSWELVHWGWWQLTPSEVTGTAVASVRWGEYGWTCATASFYDFNVLDTVEEAKAYAVAVLCLQHPDWIFEKEEDHE